MGADNDENALPTPAKKSIKLSGEQYAAIRRWVIAILQKQERAAEEAENDADAELVPETDEQRKKVGLYVGELCESYLNSLEDEIADEEQLELEYKRIHAVLRHMVRHERYLMCVHSKYTDAGEGD